MNKKIDATLSFREVAGFEEHSPESPDMWRLKTAVMPCSFVSCWGESEEESCDYVNIREAKEHVVKELIEEQKVGIKRKGKETRKNLRSIEDNLPKHLEMSPKSVAMLKAKLKELQKPAWGTKTVLAKRLVEALPPRMDQHPEPLACTLIDEDDDLDSDVEEED